MKLILLLSFLSLSFHGLESGKPPVIPVTFQESVKTEAYNVLTVKCNVCHSKKKKQDVFTLENMDSLAIDIDKQVFIKKKMPKGRKIKLTEQESSALQKWLKSTLGSH